jgi:5-methylcytosine-specific restriction endonuclease McrBC regulatory subunit McrC
MALIDQAFVAEFMHHSISDRAVSKTQSQWTELQSTVNLGKFLSKLSPDRRIGVVMLLRGTTQYLREL